MGRAKTRSYEKRTRALFFALFVFFVFIASYLVLKYEGVNMYQQTPHASVTLEELKSAIGVSAEVRSSEYVDWVMPDGSVVPLSSRQILLGTSDINGLGKYGDLTTDPDSVGADDLGKLDINNFLTPLVNNIKKYYEKNGFTLSEKNTNTTPNDLWAITLGYEKDGLYCISNLAQHSDPFAYLSCGTINEGQLALQKEFESIYREAMANEGKTTVPIVFRVSMVDNDFANGSVSSIGGYQWIAKKTDGSWKIIWTGNDMPQCTDMEKYSVPTKMYPSCYDPDSQTTISSPDYVQN